MQNPEDVKVLSRFAETLKRRKAMAYNSQNPPRK
jgi:hypothetical protein